MVGNSADGSQPRLTPDSDYGVVIPVKTFDRAKARLASALSADERRVLARRAADRVVQAATPADTFVVCDDVGVASWATSRGAAVLTPNRPGLNEAVAFAVAELRARGYRRAVVAHADLPLAESLAWVADFPGVSIVTDHVGDGTNVLSVPTSTPFNFHYGPGSGRLHRLEALRCGLSVRWLKHSQLSHDVDTPDDLERLDPAAKQMLLGDQPIAVQTSQEGTAQ